MRQRLIRDHPLPPADGVLVRALFDGVPGGDAFDRDVLIADVSYNFEVFGYYGLSLWLASDLWPMERLLSEKTRKARRVAMFSAGELLGQGLSLVPSGKVPHYDATHGLVYGVSYGGDQNTVGGAEELADRFVSAAYTVEDNSLYQQDPS